MTVLNQGPYTKEQLLELGLNEERIAFVLSVQELFESLPAKDGDGFPTCVLVDGYLITHPSANVQKSYVLPTEDNALIASINTPGFLKGNVLDTYWTPELLGINTAEDSPRISAARGRWNKVNEEFMKLK